MQPSLISFLGKELDKMEITDYIETEGSEESYAQFLKNCLAYLILY